MENQKTLIKRTLTEQIEKLIMDVEQLIELKKDFEAFIVISIGIEVLGSFHDSYGIEEFGKSETIFTNSLKKDFRNQWYSNNATKMYKNLRGPLIHQYRCGPEVDITSVCKNGAKIDLHLKSTDEKTVLILEQFFEDFKEAFTRSKNNLLKPSNSLNKEKPTKDHEKIISYNTSQGTFSASASTISNKNKKSKK